MNFTPAHIEAFRAASHDVNPLHIDPVYARRTQFGRPVVYGMAAVCYALGAWSQGRPVALRRLRAIFRKALFIGEAYTLELTEQDGQPTARFKRGTVDYAVITWEVAAAGGERLPAWTQAPAIVPRAQAAHAAELQATTVVHGLDAAAGPAFEAAFGLRADTLPLHQLLLLLWSSFHVGMVAPGEQALYADLDVAWTDDAVPLGPLALALEPVDMDERFNRYVVRGNGPGVESLRIAAFGRPRPVDFGMGDMPVFAGGERPLQDQVVFISGATRGFGASLARMCGLSGARLALNYRGDAAAAQALVDELLDHGMPAAAWPADMGNATEVAKLAAEIRAHYGQLDIIVANAAPPIRDLRWGEQTNAEFQEFVQQNLGIALETARHLLPLLKPGGLFVLISTKYLREQVAGFAHYLTAKAAQETLVQALSNEDGQHEFVVMRLPRILTDQTNLAFDLDPPRHPGEVAMEAVVALAGLGDEENFHLVELYDLED